MQVSTSKLMLGVFGTAALLVGLGVTGLPANAATQTDNTSSTFTANPTGELDCNGYSTLQAPVRASTCTDIAGNIKGAYGGKYYDNKHYIGHDEPDTTFLSNAPGSGNNVTWTETIGRDPNAAPTDVSPGHDVSHWFELTPAPWFSMAMCDPNSYPGTACTPESDSNAPTCFGVNCTVANSGGGSAFMEMQLYPPGVPPFPDSISCDDTHWCAALTIDSFTGTPTTNANPGCEEPVNFAFIQKDGVPTGPPSPQDADLASETPNNETLLMNPGDKITIHMSDEPAPGGGDAFEVTIRDLSTGQTGFMQASASNGFMTTSGTNNCAGTLFNFQPEYNTAAKANIIPWAALATNISTEFETGHWESCSTLSEPIGNPFDPADMGGDYNECNGPYENAGPAEGPTTPEAGDANCYYQGDTHPGYDGPGTSSAPDETTGCQDNVFQNGDLDFDGSPYWTEWPTSTSPGLYPGSFSEQFPTTNGRQYSQYFFQTDIALSESTCTPTSLSGCTVPPQGPGGFYPYWSSLNLGPFGGCSLQFGNVATILENTHGRDAEYGTNQFSTLGYPEFEGPVLNNPCTNPFQ